MKTGEDRTSFGKSVQFLSVDMSKTTKSTSRNGSHSPQLRAGGSHDSDKKKKKSDVLNLTKEFKNEFLINKLKSILQKQYHERTGPEVEFLVNYF